MSLIGDLGDLSKDEATAKRIIDYFEAMLDRQREKLIAELRGTTVSNVTTFGEKP